MTLNAQGSMLCRVSDFGPRIEWKKNVKANEVYISELY